MYIKRESKHDNRRFKSYYLLSCLIMRSKTSIETTSTSAFRLHSLFDQRVHTFTKTWRRALKS